MRTERRRRHRAQILLSSFFDVALSVLALVMLALLIVEFTIDLTSEWSSRLAAIQVGIWAIFVVALGIEFALAVDKVRFVKRNWIAMIAVALPLFRVLRVFSALRVLRTARVARTLTIVRSSATVNRATRAVGDFLRMSQFAWLVLTTVMVIITGAAAGYFLERGEPDAGLSNFGTALWWAATIVTTVNSQHEAVTVEGRIVGLILRVFGITAIGYITARLAAFFLGGGSAEAEARALRDEITQLRAELRTSKRPE